MSGDNPWRVPIVVMQIPETGLHREIEAGEAERAAMAALGGLREVMSAKAAFDLTPESGGRVRVTGRVQARVGQTCVVTLDPIESTIDEDVDLTFMPAEQIRELSETVDDDGEPDPGDPPEAIERGMIDIGRVAADALYLGIDPYPRKPDVVFEPVVEPDAPEEHPFAVLQALKAPAKPSRSRKPKGD
ncbi:YceD family protein [Rhodopseudomonas sp. NSM]|uniref:YceD family protein n=1 Tax=Rhodopseudomonas sp. NSM TaxID=3457630 RepID=UPI0040356F2C